MSKLSTCCEFVVVVRMMEYLQDIGLAIKKTWVRLPAGSLSVWMGDCQWVGINYLGIHCVSKNIPDIYDCNLKTIYQILIIFGKNIFDKTCHQTFV